jgi:hypothetical protein
MTKLDDLHGKLLAGPKLKRLNWRELPTHAALIRIADGRKAAFREAGRVAGKDVLYVIWMGSGVVSEYTPGTFGKTFAGNKGVYPSDVIPLTYDEFSTIVRKSGKIKEIREMYNWGQTVYGGEEDEAGEVKEAKAHTHGVEFAADYIGRKIPEAAQGATYAHVEAFMNEIGS